MTPALLVKFGFETLQHTGCRIIGARIAPWIGRAGRPQVQARSPSKGLSSVFFATLSPIRLEARYGSWIFLWTSFNVTFTRNSI
jgi:hypothetical protein